MRLTSIRLTNFRGFSDLTLTLDPQLTVLVGQNGSGKSTILEAIYRLYHQATNQHPGWTIGDVQRGKTAASLLLSANNGSADGTLLLELFVEPSGVAARPNGGFPRSAAPPAIIFYRMERSATGSPLTQQRLSSFYAFNSKPGPPAANYTYFESLVAWFRQKEDLENQERVRLRNLDYQDPALTLARHAILSFLGDRYAAPRIDRQPDITELLIDKDGAPLPATQLSDGERSLLVVAGDLARQLSQASPGGQVTDEATVLIDEIELHLHPSWQRRILPAMLRAFPKVQFIVTTHSPQVLGEVEARCLRMLENFELVEPTHPVKGRDANALLREIMDTPERPVETEKEIKAIGELLDQSEPQDGSIDRGKLAQAREKLKKLRGELGETDSEVIRLDTVLLFVGEDQGPEGHGE